ncbi:ABC transporter ATP-binding protein [Natronoarchaeum mannanilyticum]|uniref:ABC transporter domain-containing protein n=1 Tax=Natronoarchaeum mannanilyticum TaxID=926360 RepID=A0AAV3TBQ3_9EURY
MALLEAEDLNVRFYTEDGVVKAVNDLSYQIEAGETFGVVGESGAGKSVTSLSLMRLLEYPGRIESGSIRFRADDAVDRFESEYPDNIVDLGAVRTNHDVETAAARLDDRDVSGAQLTGDDRHEDVPPSELAAEGAIDLDDILDGGFGAEAGLIAEDDFVVHDGDRRYLELLRAPDDAMRKLRGNRIAMVFQDAETALNPVYSVGEQVAEAIRHHLDYDEEAARERAIEMLETVGIPDAEERYSDYPHQFSGGMQQRAVIAIALSCDPDLLICDEPTTALDVTIEAQILELLKDLAEEFDTAIQMITHDLGVIADICDRVMVMYAGSAVETAPVEDLYYDPKHPYTAGLMGSIPRIGDGRERLQTIPGTMPDLIELPPGCDFHPRCPYAEDACVRNEPPLVDTETGGAFDPADHDQHVASCLEYTGELKGDLDFEVEIRGADPRDRPGRGADAGKADPTGIDTDGGDLSGASASDRDGGELDE